MSAPFVCTHRVRFDEIDAAGIVYFAQFFVWCHDTMDAMLSGIEGGYAGLFNSRAMGLPTVHAEADFVSPLRFGDEARITATVERIGTSSVSLRFELARASDGQPVATLRHVAATTDLRTMRAHALPDDVRTAFAAYIVPS